jgi:hypothetical protein
VWAVPSLETSVLQLEAEWTVMRDNPVMKRPVRVVTLGRISQEDAVLWAKHFPAVRVVDLVHAAPSGRRFGRRVPGIGVDAAAIALKAMMSGRVAATLATNPWTAVACRLFGLRRVACTGIYSSPGTRSWRFLRFVLRDIPVVTTSHVECDQWVQAGGRARSVNWGGTTGVDPSKPPSVSRTRIFVGGTSDRAPGLVSALTDEVRTDKTRCDVIIADGSGPSCWQGEKASIQRLPYLPRTEFLRQLATSHVSYLPLADTGRAAGHMVLVASLEAGIPVVVTPVAGVAEYMVEGVTAVEMGPILPQLIARGSADSQRRGELRAHWRQSLSGEAYVARVVAALTRMGWPST